MCSYYRVLQSVEDPVLCYVVWLTLNCPIRLWFIGSLNAAFLMLFSKLPLFLKSFGKLLSIQFTKELTHCLAAQRYAFQITLLLCLYKIRHFLPTIQLSYRLTPINTIAIRESYYREVVSHTSMLALLI